MKKRIPTRICLTVLLILAGFYSCTNKKNVQSRKPEPNAAVFRYFSYEGYEPAFSPVLSVDSQYQNPILAGFYPDPSIEKVGEDYYLVNSSFAWFPGIPVFHSRDLVHWTQIGHVLDRPDQVQFDSLGISRGVFAPDITYHDGIFYVVSTLVDCGGNFVSVTEDPAGPWTDPVFLPFEGIDPSLFWDDDGKAYIVNNGAPVGTAEYDGHRAIWIQEFDPGKLEMVGKRQVIVDKGAIPADKPIWIEGPHIYKANGYYYLSAAEGGTGPQHSQVIFRSTAIWGPYTPWKNNPILTQRHLDPSRPFPVTNTGHMDMINTDSDGWWAVFLGCMPYQGDYYNTGRQTFLLPVEWTNDGWPFVLKGNETVPYLHDRPNLTTYKDQGWIPTAGNFECRDEFSDPVLPMYYNLIRNPKEKWYTLKNGNLRITPRPIPLGSLGQPSFIGRRQQHHYCRASTSMIYTPEKDGDRAGLVVFQNRDHYYFIGLSRQQGQLVIILEKGSKQEAEELLSIPVDLCENQAVQLKIEGKGNRYDFSYSLKEGDWIPVITQVDATYLSTHVAGGFVGAYFGMYAYRPEKK